MAKKITELTAIPVVVDEDLAAVVDMTDTTTKKATIAQIRGTQGIWAPVRFATTAALPTCTAAGSGVGKTLTATANGLLSLGGTAVVLGDRILVKNQATQADNGIYVVTQAGSGGTPFILTRATDADGSSDFTQGKLVFVLERSLTSPVQGVWRYAVAGTAVLETTALTFDLVDVLLPVALGGGAANPPPLGAARLQAISDYGNPMLALIGPNDVGPVIPYQKHVPSLSRTTWSLGLPNQSAMTSLFASDLLVATSAAVILAATNLLTAQPRVALSTSAVAGSVIYRRAATSSEDVFMGGLSSPANTGFRYVCVMNPANAAAVAGHRLFFGIQPNANPTNVEPNTVNNTIGFAKLSTSSNWHFVSRDGSGNTTTIDLGSGFPADGLSTDIYEMTLHSPKPAPASVFWRLRRTTSAGVVTEVSGVQTTNLPTSAAALARVLWATNNATALAVTIHLHRLCFEGEG